MKAAGLVSVACLLLGGHVPLLPAQDEFHSGAGSRCQAARDAEKRLHQANWLKIANERIEAGSERERAMISCQGEQSCFDRVAKAHGARERQLQMQAETEISRHARAVAGIDAGPCSGPNRSPAAPKEPSVPGPSDRDRRPGGANSPRRPDRGSPPPQAKDAPPSTPRKTVTDPSNLAEIGCPELRRLEGVWSAGGSIRQRPLSRQL